MNPDILDYPQNFPTAGVWQIASDILAGKSTNLAHDAHAGWHVAGFALGKALPDTGTPPVIAAKTLTKAEHDDVVKQVDAFAKGQALTAGLGVPWLAIAIALIQALLKIFPVKA